MTGAARYRALSEEAEDDLIAAAVVDGESRAGCQREMAADDRIATHETALDVDKVHRAPFPATQTRATAEELRHHRLGVRPSRQAMTVIPIGGKDIVIGSEGINGAHRHRFFADIQVTEAADLPQGIHLRAPFLKAADQQHLFVEIYAIDAVHTFIVDRAQGTFNEGSY
jgi:hypothetical protein